MEATLKSLQKVSLNLSFSRGTTYAHCPRRYYIEYVMSLRGASTEALENGTATHEALADEDSEAVPEDSPEEIQEWVGRGQEFLDSLNLVGADVKREYEFRVPIARGITLNGSMDVLIAQGRHMTILDYKTNRVMYHPDDTLQLRTYAAAVFKQDKTIQSVTAVLFFLRYNQKVAAVYTRKIMNPTLKYYKSMGKEILDRIPQGYPAFSANEHYCDGCPGAILCHLTDPRHDNDYQALAGWTMRAAAAVNQGKDLLRPYVEANGPLAVGEKEWRLNPASPTKVFDLALLSGRLHDEGINPLDVFSVSAKAVKKLPECVIEGTYTEKQNSPRFGLFKISY
ncbi:PD-(D/E)XK nuclease superfamily protein [Peptococcaceae bacterium CEB3]|nr:PD-(D/E)XK nuclease superfamily protein [Peptococcaceae bacterium CEB3]